MELNQFQILFIAFLIPLGALYWYTDKYDLTVSEVFLPTVPILHVGDIPVRVELALTDEERVQGLSGRDSLDSLKGLLFVFPEAGYYPIWMKDMNFPIDIVWISEDLKVIDIDREVSPDTYPRTFRPSKPVRYILETNAHYADTFGIHIGQEVRLPLE